MTNQLTKHRVISRYLLLVIFLLGACTTQKDTVVHRSYHATTTRFNYYFNAEESYREGLKQLEARHVDDFSNVLKVFPIGSESDATAGMTNMDRAIQKLSVAVLKHSMFIGGKEKNSWLDETYLLMGRAQLLKRDYIAARNTFDFVNTRFGKQPSAYEALLWKARMHIMTGEYASAEPLLGIVGTAIDKNKVMGKTKRAYPLVYSDLYLKQNNLEAAIPHLQKAIKVTHSKKTRIRLTYILAQVFHELGRYEEASKTYAKVLKLNPSYTFTFNARISMARCFEARKQGESRSMVKLLTKMAKDEKNLEYLDQIYFAMADVSMKSGDTASAIGYLRKSVSSSVQNPNQKALSSLQLADIYFNQPDYINAAAYYDSTMQFLAKEYPTYPIIKRKTETLTELVSNLLVIETQDSLQRLAAMPEGQRNQIIDAIIRKIVEAEAELRRQEMERQQSVQFFEQESRNMQSVTQTSVGFYFYSTQALSMGYSEFQKRWGGRKNEDLWRLSSKITSGFGGLASGDQDSAAVDSTKIRKGDPKDRSFYLADVPLTPEKVAESNIKIAQALFNAGSIYRSSLNEPDLAIESFLTLEKRYPESDLIVQAWYQLHHLYNELQFIELANRYKQKIVEKYPDSDYASLLSDPNYYSKLQAERSEGEVFYKTTYEAFMTGKSDVVTRNRAIAFAKYHDKDLLGRFEYLQVLSNLKKQPQDSLDPALNRFLAQYENTRAGDHAKLLLAQNKQESKSTASGAEADTLANDKATQGIYEFNERGPHLYVLIMDGNLVNMNDMKIMVADHNQLYHSLKKLSISSVLLDQNRHLITVSSFPSAREAMDYHKIISADAKLKESLAKGKGEMFAISSANYAKFYKRKNAPEYLSFFKQFYLKP